MGASNKICPNCGRKMKQQLIGLQHCKCGVSWKKDIGFFERTTDMKFYLERRTICGKVKQCPVIRYDDKKEAKPMGEPNKRLGIGECFGESRGENFYCRIYLWQCAAWDYVEADAC